jgi:hypothetical protein
MGVITIHGGKKYLHSDYTTAAKRKNLPEAVKKAILGKEYKEPTQVVEEPIVE